MKVIVCFTNDKGYKVINTYNSMKIAHKNNFLYGKKYEVLTILGEKTRYYNYCK